MSRPMFSIFAFMLLSVIVKAQHITSGCFISIQTRDNQFFNSYDSRGNVTIQQQGNISNPDISDELFTIEKINGVGAIYSGDKVYIKTRNNYYWNSYDSKGLVSAVNRHSDNPNISDEIFTIIRVNGAGRIKSRDKIYLVTRNGYYFNGHISTVNVSAVNRHSSDPNISDEIFSIIIR